MLFAISGILFIANAILGIIIAMFLYGQQFGPKSLVDALVYDANLCYLDNRRIHGISYYNITRGFGSPNTTVTLFIMECSYHPSYLD